MWAAWMLLGAWGLKAFQVCLKAMRENDEQDLRDESWESMVPSGVADLIKKRGFFGCVRSPV